MKSSVKKSVASFSSGCCSLLKLETKFIALEKVHRKYCGCRYKLTVYELRTLYNAAVYRLVDKKMKKNSFFFILVI